MENSSVRHDFTVALDALVEQVRDDRSVLAAILCGSLSHDTVWCKSDIDLVLVTIDDRKVPSDTISLYADGVNVHAILFPRAKFRTMVEGSLRNSFMHSFLAKGRLLYTHAETPLAQIEVIGAGLLADREVIPQATKLNPELFATVYTELLNTKKSAKQVRAALDALDAYIAERATTIFAPVFDHLRDVGEARSFTEIETHFEKTFGVGNVTGACEYLADQGLIGK